MLSGDSAGGIFQPYIGMVFVCRRKAGGDSNVLKEFAVINYSGETGGHGVHDFGSAPATGTAAYIFALPVVEKRNFAVLKELGADAPAGKGRSTFLQVRQYLLENFPVR